MNVGMDSPFGVPTLGVGDKHDRGLPFVVSAPAMPFSSLALGIALAVLVTFIAFFASFSQPTQQSEGLVGLDIVLWGCLVFLILVNGMAYLFSIDVNASIRNLFSKRPTVDITVQEYPEAPMTTASSLGGEQVFHVSDNRYTYPDAQAICKAYGGRLASIQEMEHALDNGAEWCNYGWSQNQMALYPTQLKRWEKLQTIKGHEHDCGRPGINGGYIANPNIRFGVNCFGRKPEPTQCDRELMQDAQEYPLTAAEVAFNKRVEEWRAKLNTLLVSPFNASEWSG